MPPWGSIYPFFPTYAVTEPEGTPSCSCKSITALYTDAVHIIKTNFSNIHFNIILKPMFVSQGVSHLKVSQ